MCFQCNDDVVLRTGVSWIPDTSRMRGFLATINTSAEKMLHLKSQDVLRESYRSLLWGQHLNLARDVMGDDWRSYFPLVGAIFVRLVDG